jgi:hypothetical protein
LDEKIRAEEGILAFGFGLKRLSKKEVSGIKKEQFFTFLFNLGDQGRFLGDTAKGTSESPAGLNLTHHIIGIDDAELGFRCSPGVGWDKDEPDDHMRKDYFIVQCNPHYYPNSNNQIPRSK